MNNRSRCDHAFYALQCYQSHKGEDMKIVDREDQIVDLIADLLHLVHQELSLETEMLLLRAKNHFYAEIKGELRAKNHFYAEIKGE